MLQQVDLALNIVFLPNYLLKGLERNDRDKGSSGLYCNEIAALSINNQQFLIVDKDRDRNLHLEEIVVNEEICKVFKIDSSDTIIVAEKLTYLECDIR
jgi:hypothetical protein